MMLTAARNLTTMQTLKFPDPRLLFLICLAVVYGAYAGAVQTDTLHDSAQQAGAAAVHEVPSAAPAFPPPQKPRSTPLERNLFWSTWWIYNAAFVADFTTTGMVLYRGGREADPIYTLFGDKNMAGVIGSAVVFRVVTSIISTELCKAARKRHGAWRYILNATATGLNAYFIVIHTGSAFNNVGVYKDLKK